MAKLEMLYFNIGLPSVFLILGYCIILEREVEVMVPMSVQQGLLLACPWN